MDPVWFFLLRRLRSLGAEPLEALVRVRPRRLRVLLPLRLHIQAAEEQESAVQRVDGPHERVPGPEGLVESNAGGAEAAVSAVALELGKDKKGGSSSGMKTSFIDSDRVELAIELFQSEEARRVCQYDDIDEALWKNDGDYDASKYTRTETIVATLAMLKAVRYCESSSSKGNRTFADLPNEICINCGNAARRSLAVESVARAAGVKCDTEEQGSALYVTLPKSSLKSFMKVRN